MRLVAVDPVRPDGRVLQDAGRVLRRGGLVAFPTETVYGLGANALDPVAVEGIFRAKDRDRGDPLVVHIAAASQLGTVANRPLTDLERRLTAVFWPGPLTLVLPKQDAVPAIVTSGWPTVAVRMPSHPVARGLIRAAGVPVAAPSANLFRRPSATEAVHVLADLASRVDLVLDGGPAPLGLESTIVLCEGDREIRVLRPGAVTVEALAEAAGPGVAVVAGRSPGAAVPGQDVVHYQPRAVVQLVDPGGLDQAVEQAGRESGGPVAVLACREDLDALGLAEGVLVGDLGPAGDLAVAGQRLFATLRRLDEEGAAIIVARDFPEHGLGLALHDRLTRAAARLPSK